VIRLGPGTGYAVNNLGDVVGQGESDNGGPEAILWRLGQQPMFLGYLTQDQTLYRWSIAWGINDARQICGSSTFSWDLNVSGDYPEPPTYPVWSYTSSVHAFLWQNGMMTELSDLSFGQPVNTNAPDPTGKGYSDGHAINRYGVIVGKSETDLFTQNIGYTWHLVHGPGHPVKFNGIAPIDLGIAASDVDSEAWAINERGAIAGGWQGDEAAFFQFSGQTQFFALPGGSTQATGLNNLDHVVGVMGGSLNAFIWVPTSSLPENERFIDLGPMSLEADLRYTDADAINDRDEIVGSGSFGFAGVREPLLWQNGKVHRLNDVIGARLNVPLLSAPAISQNGMIVANTGAAGGGEAFLLVPDELMVDANNDGKMSFTNAAVHDKDRTKQHAPYQFWVNDDRDEGDDDVPVDGLPDWTKNVIDRERGLEDFTRLWIGFKGLTDLVKSAGIQLQLEWQPDDGGTTWRPADGNPAIKLFPAAEPDGGRKYLDKRNGEEAQIQPPHNTAYGIVRRDFPLLLSLTPGALDNLTEEQPNLYLLFEGVARGKGRLVLKLLKNGQPLGEYPPLYMEIKDVKDMYERWTVGDVTQPNRTISSSIDYQIWPSDTPEQEFGISGSPMPAPTREEEKDYILMVHGWNTSPFDKACTGDTAFKRLFWQGFNGRFGLFRWPTFFYTSHVPPPHHFDASEQRAWASSVGLLNLIAQLNSRPFAGRVRLTGHSMGNIVASEALRRSQNGPVVHTYIASQAAMSAHCYDATIPPMEFAFGTGPTTPDVYASYWQDGAASQPHQWLQENRPSYMHPNYMHGKAEQYFNYYNRLDFALATWEVDQQSKPDDSYKYIRQGSPPTVGFRRKVGPNVTWLTFPSDTYEIFAWAAESQSIALGALPAHGVFAENGRANVNLGVAPFNYGLAPKFHSGQFRDSNARRNDYWRSLLTDMRLRPQ
jgi:hypothetical protein